MDSLRPYLLRTGGGGGQFREQKITRTQKINRTIKDGFYNSRGLNSFRICVDMWVVISLIILLTWGGTPGPAKLLPSPYLLRNKYAERQPLPMEGDVGSRLILTPYIEDGRVEEARALSAVSGGPFPEDIPSHSGFFTVNKQYNSSLFFWFFPAEVSNPLQLNLYKCSNHCESMFMWALCVILPYT